MPGDLVEHNMLGPMVNFTISSVSRTCMGQVTTEQVILLCHVSKTCTLESRMFLDTNVLYGLAVWVLCLHFRAIDRGEL